MGEGMNLQESGLPAFVPLQQNSTLISGLRRETQNSSMVFNREYWIKLYRDYISLYIYIH